jgi:CRP-like cAMP-binding protein
MADMLSLSAHLPVIEVEPGDRIVEEGTTTGGIWVLVNGTLRVVKAGMHVNTISDPGAVIGEMAVLLDAPHSATVEAMSASTLRYAAEGAALLAGDVGITQLVAVGLANRLLFVTTYLADLTRQYADIPGLSMVSEVLSGLEQHSGPPAVPGSMRDPDPEY